MNKKPQNEQLIKYFEELFSYEKGARDLYDNIILDLKDLEDLEEVKGVRDDEEKHMEIVEKIIKIIEAD